MGTRIDRRQTNMNKWFDAVRISGGDLHSENATAYANELGVSITRAESKEMTWAILNLCSPGQFSVLFGHPAGSYEALVGSFYKRLEHIFTREEGT